LHQKKKKEFELQKSLKPDFPLHPNILFKNPLTLYNQKINWIEISNLFILPGVSPSYVSDTLKNQTQHYIRSYGPGAILWISGYVQPTLRLFDPTILHLTFSSEHILGSSETSMTSPPMISQPTSTTTTNPVTPTTTTSSSTIVSYSHLPSFPSPVTSTPRHVQVTTKKVSYKLPPNNNTESNSKNTQNKGYKGKNNKKVQNPKKGKQTYRAVNK